MNINTSKQATIAAAVLAAVGGQFALRSTKALARTAGCTEQEAAANAVEMGLVAKRRRSDGATLYGIAGRVNGDDVAHVPATVWTPGARHALQRSESQGGSGTA